MKGKGKVITAHIFNALGIIATGFLATILMQAGGKAAQLKMIAATIFFVSFAVVLAAEIVLIVFQAKHKYGKAVFISGLVSSIFLIICVCAMVLVAYLYDNEAIIVGILLEGGEVILIAGIVNTILYPLIRKANVGVVEPAAKAVVEQKVETPVVEEKPVAENKPAPVKKAPVKKAAPKKAVAKKPAAKKPVAKKKPAAKKKSK